MLSDAPSDHFALERQSMVNSQLRRRGITDQSVLDAMGKVPRHEFVSENDRSQAYEDHPLPIAEGQTISQPYIVALMLQALSLEPGDRVLEIGTGSGYQTALLAELTQHVYSVERHAQLAEAARITLSRLGYHNVSVLIGDGSQGWPDMAPFDAIVVSAAAPRVPAALFEQSREGGRMILPVGPSFAQELQLVRKQNGLPVVTHLDGCRFVPLIGVQGYSSDSG
ncbi:MAG: protein-L-isoaspartate(D-aspartate) O-methyltransferase [Terriglobales bacterium]|jgi:protein-L-isoaspartate(D-aspartate) O-methyltransferase